MKILINGGFFCKNLTGIERYAYEITARLDKISKPDEIAVIVPANADVPQFANLKLIRLKKKLKSHPWWKLVTLQWFLITHRNYTILDYGNTCLPFAPGLVFLHDIYFEFFPEDFVNIRDKIGRLYYRRQYRLIAKKAKKIITVSYFSRNQIIDNFKTDPAKISVIYNGADHIKSINEDNTVFNDFPVLAEKPFYFSLGSLSKRKNLKWIIEYASKHTDQLFAISGTSLSTLKNKIDNAIPSNVLFLGYLKDSQVKALMTKCKAFLFPSYYEGFGIPPLEALACGAPVIVSNAASLPEIYGASALYIDPYNADVDLDEMLKQPVDKPDAILSKYSYDTSAQQVYELIQDVIC